MSEDEQEPGMGKIVGKTLVGFPKYIFEWTVGLLIAILTDLHITTLAVTGVFVGLAASSVIVGFAAFFAAYSLSRIINNHAQGTVAGANIIRAGLSDIASS